MKERFVVLPNFLPTKSRNWIRLRRAHSQSQLARIELSHFGIRVVYVPTIFFPYFIHEIQHSRLIALVVIFFITMVSGIITTD